MVPGDLTPGNPQKSPKKAKKWQFWLFTSGANIWEPWSVVRGPVSISGSRKLAHGPLDGPEKVPEC